MTMATTLLQDRFRPKLHFSPFKNWMNDPNGLVWFAGEWHMFFQYNPQDKIWGHMSWGHAVSHDLIHWEELPLAIPEDDAHMIFSGSCVVDWKNTSGLGDGLAPPLLAFYTGHAHAGDHQVQCLAFSHDKGRSWRKYAGNPVLDAGMAEFRDPKVFWHEPSGQWIMVVVRAMERIISIYGAIDLIHWAHLSDFGPAGLEGKLWECPDLFELPIEGETGTQWVMKVDLFERADAAAKLSVPQLFFGQFDGRHFTPDFDATGAPRTQIADAGRDFYAAMSWSDVPERDGRRIWIGWMNSHHYAKDTPTGDWRGAMTLPRAVSLRRGAEGVYLAQSPVAEIEAQRGAMSVLDASAQPLGDGPQELLLRFDAGHDLTLTLAWPTGAEVQLGYRAQDNLFFVDRSASGALHNHSDFIGDVTAERRSGAAQIELRLILDSCSLELFCDNGDIALSELIFPPEGAPVLHITTEAQHRIQHWPLGRV